MILNRCLSPGSSGPLLHLIKTVGQTVYAVHLSSPDPELCLPSILPQVCTYLKSCSWSGQGLRMAHLIRDWGLNVKSPEIKVCAKIDAPMAAGLSQQPKLCGGEERWVEVTLRDSGCWRHMCSDADARSSSSSVDFYSLVHWWREINECYFLLNKVLIY